ncbi:hypothetical protein WJX72_008395 [[Myrmecia] bisecta]|uniref:RING-CH-type domain-containing protein n=1 Tax=[Myrmecia] bisecta TaxID=41462 RepID=A0AAW1P473_9CHLO
MDEEGPYACRFCFDETDDVAELISPCKCKGTQAYVHSKCLRKWQENVLALHTTRRDERAHRCSVCHELFSQQPPSIGWGLRMSSALRGVGGAICISLLAFGLSGPPWPHLALLVLLLLGTRSHSLLLLALLLLGSLLATMHARGLRVVLRLDGSGRLGLAFIRHGAPVEGLRPGVLLVASEELDRTVFARSVIMLYEHDTRMTGRGARGVMLSKPLPAHDMRAAQPGEPRWMEGARQVGARHFMGGPVGLSGEQAALEMAVLHTVAGVPGSRVLVPSNTSGPAAQDGHAGLFEGGDLAQVVQRAGTAQRRRRRSAAGAADVRIFHGVCAWADAQLEGEINVGSWGWVADSSLQEVLETPPDQLWQRLTSSPGRIRWTNR